MKKENRRKALSILLIAFMAFAMIPALTTPVLGATEAQIEASVAAGVAYLAAQQLDDGSWGPWQGHGDCPAYTGLVLLKLEDRAYELCYDSPFDPAYDYSSNVTKGWEYLFSVDASGNPIHAKKQTLSTQDHTAGASGTIDNPDTNGNGYGIYFDGSHAVYETGIVLMALVDSGTPNRLNDGGIDYDGDGNVDTFKEIAQDVADWLAFAQSDSGGGEGGWSYAALNNAAGDPDQSNSGYAVLGLAAAEATVARHAPKAEAFACTVPNWVKIELNAWIGTIQDPPGPPGDPNDGGSWYRSWWTWINQLKTGNLIFEMTFYGDTPGLARFDNAIDYIERHWKDPNNDPGWGFGQSPAHYQAMFCLMKGFEYSGINLIDLDGDGIPEHDWFAEFSTVLVNQQSTVDGSWPAGDWGDQILNTAWALLTLEKTAPPPVRMVNKKVFKKVKMIPAPVQFWREFIGGVTDIIVFDPPEIIEPVALVREYLILHEGEDPIPLEFLTWENMDGYPWEPIDPPDKPYILPPDEVVEYDIYTAETDTAVLVRYTVAWASTPDIIEAHFINEAILESKSPQVIVGQLSNFDVHNDYHEPVDNFELELYGIQPSDVVGWFPGWGAPPQISSMPPKAGMPGGTEVVWMDPDQPVLPCNWEHFGLHLKPGVIAEGVKAYWTQTPSAELGDVIYVKIDVTVPGGETVTVVDTLPSGVAYLSGTFTVDGVPATPTITKIGPPPKPPIHEITYTVTTPGTHLIEFVCKVDTAYWEDREVCNVVTATWYDEETGEPLETKEDVECFTIHAFEELHKNVGIPKADVVFAIDLTGSMWDEIATVKAQAANIMNNLAAQIADVQFGLISYMDYDGTYSTTAPGSVPVTYTALYGSAASGDYPYKLDQDITSDTVLMAGKIAGLTIGWGADGPQDYTRIIHEAYNDTNLHWRTDAKRILILFGDNVPHDTNFDNDNDGTLENTGGDPGRNTILGDADDLDFETEVANAVANGVHIMAVYSGWAGERYPWTYMAAQTGGGYFQLDEAEQIPDAIKDLIKKQAEETLTIKEKTETQWAVVIDVINPFPYTMTNVMIKDNFGAEIEIDKIVSMTADCNGDAEVDIMDLSYVARAFGTDWTWPEGTGWNQWNPKTDFNRDGRTNVLDLHIAARSYGSYATWELILDETGMSEKVHLWWYIGDLAPGETARLILLVSTDLNPAGHQEYTEPGIYELNSGATLTFIDPLQNMQLSAVTDSIYVTVLPIDDC